MFADLARWGKQKTKLLDADQTMNETEPCTCLMQKRKMFKILRKRQQRQKSRSPTNLATEHYGMKIKTNQQKETRMPQPQQIQNPLNMNKEHRRNKIGAQLWSRAKAQHKPDLELAQMKIGAQTPRHRKILRK